MSTLKQAPSRRGVMLILSSPSGAGKTTLTKLLLQNEKQVVISISMTTRSKRPAEKEGIDYYFVTPEQFKEKVEQNGFLEYAEVFGASYGTPRQQVEELLENGYDVLFDIDWQGAAQLTQKARKDVVSIFILPPSLSELERRLRGRAQDSEEVIVKRMEKATEEISHWTEYDYVVVNDTIEQSLKEISSILCAEHRKCFRQKNFFQ